MEPDRGKTKSDEPLRVGGFDNALAPILLFFLVVLIYQNSLAVPMIFDDHYFIERNESIRDIGDLGAIWSFNPARFFTFLSLAVNHHFGGLNVRGYHVFNIIVHFLVCWTLFWFVKLLLSTGKDQLFGAGSRLTRLFPFFVATVFAAHPLNTQAVTYIWQRNTSLVTLFYLLAMALYLKFALTEKRDESRHKLRWLLLAGAFFASIIATLTKQNAATLPFAILLLDYCFISGSVAGLKDRAKVLALFLPALFVIPILTATGGNMEISHIGAAERILPWYEYLATQFNVIVFVYFKLVFFPVGQTIEYDFPAVTSLADASFSIIILLSLLAASIFFFNKSRLVSFGFLFFTLTMSVESSFFPLEDLVFEHRMYLPSTGLYVSIVALLFMVVSKVAQPKATFVTLSLLLAVLVAPLSTLTIKRNEVWQTRESFWLDVVAKSPKRIRGYTFLCQEYRAQGRLDKVRDVAKKAFLIDPSSGYTLFNLGLVTTLLEKDHEKAIGLFKKALVDKPNFYQAYYALGDLYRERKSYGMATRSYKMGLLIENKNNIVALMALAESQSFAGLYVDAIATYNLLLQLTPGNETVHKNLSILYNLTGEKGKAALNENVTKKPAPPPGVAP